MVCIGDGIEVGEGGVGGAVLNPRLKTVHAVIPGCLSVKWFWKLYYRVDDWLDSIGWKIRFALFGK